MPAARNLTLLVRHAAQAGDWPLVELLGPFLAGRFGPGRRAYLTLVTELGLGLGSANQTDRR